jgi:hypothetical protein
LGYCTDKIERYATTSYSSKKIFSILKFFHGYLIKKWLPGEALGGVKSYTENFDKKMGVENYS